MGSGNNTVVINNTGAAMTNAYSGAGNDTITVVATTDPLAVDAQSRREQHRNRIQQRFSRRHRHRRIDDALTVGSVAPAANAPIPQRYRRPHHGHWKLRCR